MRSVLDTTIKMFSPDPGFMLRPNSPSAVEGLFIAFAGIITLGWKAALALDVLMEERY